MRLAHAVAGVPRPAPHPDPAALILLVVVIAAIVVVGVLWTRSGEQDRRRVRPEGGSRELRQVLVLGEQVWWPEFERQFASYVEARHTGKRH